MTVSLQTRIRTYSGGVDRPTLFGGDRSDLCLTYRAFPCEIRSITNDTSGRIIKGRAILFERWQRAPETNERMEQRGSYYGREKFTHESVRVPDLSEVVNNAMDKALKRTYHDVKALVNHDQQKYLGSMFKRSLRLEKNKEGLDFEMSVPNTSLGNDLIGIIENEGGQVSTSIGFLGEGKGSNIKKVMVDDKAFDNVIEGRANVEVATPLDNVEINLQEGKLNGSDYVESMGKVPSGRPWRVYKSLDLREISFLIGVEPAHEGTFAQLGSGKPQPSNTDQAYRARQLEMIKLRC